MPPSKTSDDLPSDAPASALREDGIEYGFIGMLQGLKKLLIMRPYQVYAVQRMVKRIEDDASNGFVWQTTDRSETLTSFKASTLAALRNKLLTKTDER